METTGHGKSGVSLLTYPGLLTLISNTPLFCSSSSRQAPGTTFCNAHGAQPRSSSTFQAHLFLQEKDISAAPQQAHHREEAPTFLLSWEAKLAYLYVTVTCPRPGLAPAK